VTLIKSGWVPETLLTVTALPSSVEGVVVLRVVGEVDLATVGWLREHLHKYLSSGEWFWISPRCHFWQRVGSTCWPTSPSRPAPKGWRCGW
jgi:hypothetical protein